LNHFNLRDALSKGKNEGEREEKKVRGGKVTQKTASSLLSRQFKKSRKPILPGTARLAGEGTLEPNPEDGAVWETGIDAGKEVPYLTTSFFAYV